MRNLNLKILTALVSLTWAGSGAIQEPMDIKEWLFMDSRLIEGDDGP